MDGRIIATPHAPQRTREVARKAMDGRQVTELAKLDGFSYSQVSLPATSDSAQTRG
jgi:hypothetical protein